MQRLNKTQLSSIKRGSTRDQGHMRKALWRAITMDMSTANLKNHELERTSEVTESGVTVIKTALCRIIDSYPNPFISSSLHLVDSIWCRFWHVACSTRNSQVRCPKLPACGGQLPTHIGTLQRQAGGIVVVEIYDDGFTFSPSDPDEPQCSD
jgi:hypothetical protein